ncbi:MAG TPA: histidine phosphatase family protein [Geminicoccaceae bacterium]|nr:histidine phosphatase family protein [Geminicoccaceae bacterium]
MILVRHAESEWNFHYGRTRIDPGIPDPPLTGAGRAQAEELAELMAAEGVARLISSPYRRALETASIIARRLDLAIAVEPLVRERCAFSCDIGTPPALLRSLWPALDFAHLEEQWWGQAEETVASVVARGAAFRAKTADLPERARTVVITHWGFIRALTGHELSNARFVRLHADAAPTVHPMP